LSSWLPLFLGLIEDNKHVNEIGPIDIKHIGRFEFISRIFVVSSHGYTTI